MSEQSQAPQRRVFRLPGLAYLAVLLLLIATAPIAFSHLDLASDNGAGNGGGAPIGWQTLLLLVPVLAAVFIARSATIVDHRGFTVRAVFGSRTLTWEQVRGLTVSGRSVYATTVRGSVRLPCVRVSDLAEVARASDGRLPRIADPTPKYAPQRRRR